MVMIALCERQQKRHRCIEQSGDSLNKLQIELPYDPASHYWAYTPRKPELKETHVP